MRLKDVVELVNEKTDRVDRPYVALENIVSWEAKFVATDAVTEGTNACFKAGDVLFGKLRPYLAKGYLPDYDGICSTEFLVMRPRRDINGRYILYWMLSPDFIGVIKNRVAGVKMPRTDWATISQMELTLPGLDSQRKIVAYLDEKSAAIDARVAVLEKKLAAYKRLKASVINRAVTRGLNPKAKLKDSGVEWIGKVPAGWEVRNLSQCFGFFKGLAITKADLTETGIPVISYGQIHSKLNIGTHLKPELLRYVPEAIAAADPNSRLKVGDIVFADTSEDVEGCGNCVLMDAGSPVYAGYHAIVARPDESRRSRYFSYLFNASCWRSQIRSKVAGIKVFSITQRIFKGVSLLLPSIADANAIADYLDAECAKIDKMAELVTLEIELYKKLKRSLINEVVTGKRNVG